MSSLPRTFSLCVLVLLVSTVEIHAQCTLNPLFFTLAGGVSYRLGYERSSQGVQEAASNAVERAEEDAAIQHQQALATANAEAQANQQAAVDKAVATTTQDLRGTTRFCLIFSSGNCPDSDCAWDPTITVGATGCTAGFCLLKKFS